MAFWQSHILGITLPIKGKIRAGIEVTSLRWKSTPKKILAGRAHFQIVWVGERILNKCITWSTTELLFVTGPQARSDEAPFIPNILSIGEDLPALLKDLIWTHPLSVSPWLKCVSPPSGYNCILAGNPHNLKRHISSGDLTHGNKITTDLFLSPTGIGREKVDNA